MSVEIENIRKDIRMRAETDSIMSIAWILVYLLPIIAAFLWASVVIAVTISTLVSVITNPPSPGQTIPTPVIAPVLVSFVYLLLLVILVSFVAYLVLIYLLVKRRNTHFKRQMFLSEDLVAAAKAIAAKRGIDVGVGFASLDRTVREAKADETSKDAVLWAILSAFTGTLVWYVWYFLMKDFSRHEIREDGFWQDFGRVLDKLGIKFSVPKRMQPMPDRSFALYLVLTIITLGFFGIYWLYTLLRDPNDHFRYHMQIDDMLLTTLEASAI